MRLQSLLDQREDLVQERDAYKCKLRRLNSAMAALLKADAHALIDVDWLLAENRHLREALEQAHDEKRLANAMGKRYKAALEKTRADTVARARAKAGGRTAQETEVSTLLGGQSGACGNAQQLILHSVPKAAL